MKRHGIHTASIDMLALFGNHACAMQSMAINRMFTDTCRYRGKSEFPVRTVISFSRDELAESDAASKSAQCRL